MSQRSFNVLAVASLALCVATSALWVRSYWAADDLVWEGLNRALAVGSDKGRVTIGEVSDPGGFRGRGLWCQVGKSPDQLTFKDLFGDAAHEWMGFGYAHFVSGATYRLIMLPLWFVCFLFALGPGIVLTGRVRRGRKTQRGHCITCGYDLRATPDRCPECGTAVQTSRGASR